MANLRYETFLHLLAATNLGKQNYNPDSIINRYIRLFRSDVKWNTRQQKTDTNQNGSTVRSDAPSVVNLMGADSLYESKPRKEYTLEVTHNQLVDNTTEISLEDTPNQLVDNTTEISFRKERQESNTTEIIVHKSTWDRIVNPKHKLT
jgi:hypothetical protein